MSLSGNPSTDKLLIGDVKGLNSIHGKSAYELAVLHGFDGTEEEWLASLKGADGKDGKDGAKGDTYTLTEADKVEIADKVATDNLQESAEKYIDSVIEEKDLEVTRTATGSAITIESANAPIPYLKLSGKTTQDGTPTPTEPKELKSVGDSGSFGVYLNNTNLFAIGNKSGYFTTYNNGLYIGSAVGTISSDIDFTISGDTIEFTKYSTESYPWISKWVKLRKNTQYVLSSEPVQSYIRIVGVNSKATGTTGTNIIDFGNGGASTKVFNSGNYDYYFISIYPYGVGYKVNKLQINIGSSKLEYERGVDLPSLTMPYTLRSVGDTKDEVDFNKGVNTKYFGGTTITSSDDINMTSYDKDVNTETHFFAIDKTSDNSFAKHDTIAISNYFPPVVCWNVDKVGVYSHKNGIGIRINKSLLADVSTEEKAIQSFKDWLSGKTVKVIYYLPNVTETPLTETELNAYRQLYTNKGNTTILSEADMTLDYYTPKGQPLGNIHSQINKDYFKLQQAIISTGGN